MTVVYLALLLVICVTIVLAYVVVGIGITIYLERPEDPAAPLDYLVLIVVVAALCFSAWVGYGILYDHLIPGIPFPVGASSCS